MEDKRLVDVSKLFPNIAKLELTRWCCRTHVVMFHASLLLSVAVRFIIANPDTNAVLPVEANEAPTTPTSENPTPSPKSPSSSSLLSRAAETPNPIHEVSLQSRMSAAKWTVSIALSVIITCLTILALLGRSLDAKGTFKIDNRYLRLALRPVVIIIALLLPLRAEMHGSSLVGIVLGALYACMMVEWFGSLDREGGWIER